MTDIQAPARRALDSVVIRFAVDSGDGMQLTGDRFTQSSAVFGNELATLPDLPAEIGRRRGRWAASAPSRSTSRTTRC